MRKLLPLVLLFCFLSLPASAEKKIDDRLTLSEAYRLALKRSEEVAMQAEDLEAAKGRFYRSLNVILPSIYWQTTRLEKDVNEDSGSSSDGISSDSRRRVTPEAKFVFSQPLFSGFKEIAALRASGADRSQQEFELERAKDVLFTDVAESFYAVLVFRRDAETLESVHSLLEERLKDIESRVAIGRSRESELKTTFADLKLVEADLSQARVASRAAKNLLSFYVGPEVFFESLSDDLLGEEEVPSAASAQGGKTPADLRPDVRAAEEAWRLADSGVLEARSGFLPQATLDGNYYTHRVGFQSGTDWDVLLTLKVPVFDGAETIGNVKEASAEREKARLESVQTLREARLDALDATEDLEGARESARALEAAERASKENYDILNEEYRLNLVSNLDVLDALRQYQDVRRRHNEAHYEARKAYWRYKVATDGMSAYRQETK